MEHLGCIGAWARDCAHVTEGLVFTSTAWLPNNSAPNPEVVGSIGHDWPYWIGPKGRLRPLRYWSSPTVPPSERTYMSPTERVRDARCRKMIGIYTRNKLLPSDAAQSTTTWCVVWLNFNYYNAIILLNRQINSVCSPEHKIMDTHCASIHNYYVGSRVSDLCFLSQKSSSLLLWKDKADAMLTLSSALSYREPFIFLLMSLLLPIL